MEQFITLVTQMAPYLLLGFLFAGIMHAFIPSYVYTRYLSSNSFASVFNAAIFGIPLPLCSCGVIPTAMSLRKEGASKASTVSFLIATPQTGVDSILATYGLMGLPFAIIRPIAALFTAILGGCATMLSDKNAHSTTLATNTTAHSEGNAKTFFQKCTDALQYGYVTMMQDIGKWLVIGLLVAAIITICIPTHWFAAFKGNTVASMLLVLCIAIPMYVCATGSIPVAVALMMKGLTPGAALVLLMAGPACNAASMLVVHKVLGKRTLAVYILSIIAGAVAFGSAIDFMHFNGIVDFMANFTTASVCCSHHTSWVEWGSTLLLTALLINALILKYKHNNSTIKTDNSMKTFQIEGMSCNHCRISAEKAIQGVEGVTSASVDLQTKEAYVEGNASAEDICKAVEAVGFSCNAK